MPEWSAYSSRFQCSEPSWFHSSHSPSSQPMNSSFFPGWAHMYAYMWAHPGKKLLFMGCELGEWEEWNHDGSLHWNLLEYADHSGIQSLVRDLNRTYRATPA